MISIVGSKGVGKDLVGAIMLLLLSDVDKVMDRVTKDILDFGSASYSSEELDGEWKIKKWATPLKVTMEALYSESFTVEEWEANKDNYKEEFVPALGMSRREKLIRLGDSFREKDPDTFVKALIIEYLEYVEEHDRAPKWIITDTRRENEYDAVMALGGISVLVKRKQDPPLGVRQEWVATHPSETELLDDQHDYTIINDGTVDDLTASVKEILAKEGLLK